MKTEVKISLSQIKHQSEQKTQLGLARNINHSENCSDWSGATFVSTAFVQSNMMTEHKRTEKEGSDAYLSWLAHFCKTGLFLFLG